MPVRMCRVCRRRFEQSELTRWTMPDGHLAPDEGAKAPGRGMYTCSDNCTQKLKTQPKLRVKRSDQRR